MANTFLKEYFNSSARYNGAKADPGDYDNPSDKKNPKWKSSRNLFGGWSGERLRPSDEGYSAEINQNRPGISDTERIEAEELEKRATKNGGPDYDQALELGFVRLKSLTSGAVDSARETLHFAVVDPYSLALDNWLTWNWDRLGRPANQTVDANATSAPWQLNVQRVVVSFDVFQNILKALKKKETEEPQRGYVAVVSYERRQELEYKQDENDATDLISLILQEAYEQRASDIHLDPSQSSILIRLRIDGFLSLYKTYDSTIARPCVARLKYLAGLDVSETRTPQDGSFNAEIMGNSVDLRMSTYPTIHGEKVVLRLLDQRNVRTRIDRLITNENQAEQLKKCLRLPQGLILISGPTGSGKSTTLYAALSEINRDRYNVMTVEDPVEYRLNGVYQMQVNEDIGLTFAKGLRTILRQDPDVIMVGECRDEETAAMAVQSALTGHLVFSTVHTNSALEVIQRMVDLKVNHSTLGSALTLAVGQRLVRKICTGCKQEVDLSKAQEELSNNDIPLVRARELNALELDKYYRGGGCQACNNSGYAGRQAIYEIMEVTETMRKILARKEYDKEAVERAVTGYNTIHRQAREMVESGETSLYEMVRVLDPRGQNLGQI